MLRKRSLGLNPGRLKRVGIVSLLLAQVVAVGVHSPQAAFASATISLPTTLSAGTSFTSVNTAGALSISGYSAGATVQVTIGVDRGFVKISTTTGLTAPTGYTSAAWTANTSTEISFSGSEGNVSAALNSLQYRASGVNVPATISVTSFVAGAAFNSTTGHFYEIIDNVSTINWEEARCKAKWGPTSSFNGTVSTSSVRGNTSYTNDRCTNKTSRRSMGGLKGYLATITSLEEHDFLRGKLSGTGWIGGSDIDSEGTFIWMDGPEVGQVFWNSSSTARRQTTTVSGSVSGYSYGSNRFNFFSDGEPNNSSSAEHWAEFGFGPNGAWNDCQNGCNRSRYVIEYGEDGDTLSGASGVINVNPRVVVSTETDTALFFNESSAAGQHARLESSTALGTFNAISLQMWVKPLAGSACAGNLLSKADNFALYCVSGGTLAYALSGAGAWVGVSTGIPIPAGSWSHIALTRIASTGTNGVKVYLNGQHVFTGSADGAGTSPIGNSNTTFLNFAGRNNSGDFRGSIDEVKIWREDRSASIATDMTSNASSTTNLVGYWNFNEGTGTKIFNQASTATYLTDLDFSGTPRWEPVAVSSTSGPYSIVTFPRTIITSSGGWKVPAGVTQVSTLVVAGGGGGGSRVGGGGGAGGYVFTGRVTLTPNQVESITVGQGGLGAQRPNVNEWQGRDGQNSQLGSRTTAIGGGGGGGYNTSTNPDHAGRNGGSGGGAAPHLTTSGNWPAGIGLGTSGQGNNGGSGFSGTSGFYPAGGGGGAGGVGGTATSSVAGSGGIGILDPIGNSGNCLASGGGGGAGTSASVSQGSAGTCVGGTTTATSGTKGQVVPANATANSGSGGGGAGYVAGNSNDVAGGSGGSGIIIIRWITATAPTFTAPAAIDTTTALTRYTFRAGGSATSPLIRNFQWQFSSDTGTTWSTVQASTSDSYTTGLLDLGTSGPRYRYRVIVTDSDTAGLSISDSSTAHLVLNRYPTISPPSSNDAGLLVHLDASQSSSYPGSGSTWNDLSGGGRNASLGISSGGPIAAGYGSGVTCSAPTYSSSNGGIFAFAGNTGSTPRNCAWVSGSSFANVGETYTVEMWVNPASPTQVAYSSLISTPWNVNDKINFAIAFNGTTTTAGVPDIWGGVFDGTNWYQTPNTGIPVNSWSHVVLTSANRTLTLYVNGESRQLKELNSAPGGAGKGVLIGRRWDGNDTINGSIGTVRISNTALAAEQIRQNYYLSSNRFSNSASGVKSSSTTYATTLTETFTATNGTGTKRFTFTPNNRAGIVWDTSTANSAVLRVTSDLNAGTYYETMTATDSATASTSVGLTITINKARQASLSIGQYNAFPGVSTYPINVYGGSGSGAVVRSLTDSGTASCSLASSMFLSAIRPGTCTIRAVKAGDTNYLSETATATIYWIQWSDAYATRAASTPTEIVLNHSTAITKYNYETLTVTSYQNSSGVTITSIAASSVIRIIGDGFSPTAAYTEVTFANRNLDPIDLTSGLQIVSASGTHYLQLTLPAGITTGAITVNSPKGMAVGPVLTIVP